MIQGRLGGSGFGGFRVFFARRVAGIWGLRGMGLGFRVYLGFGVLGEGGL